MRVYFKEFYELMFSKSKEGWNATLDAARNGNLELLKFLRKENISFKHRSESDRNALHIACDHGHLDTCKYVSKECPSLLHAVDHKGRHACHFAARGGNVDIMKYLASTKKADVTKETNAGMNILQMAFLHSHSEMCKYILSIYPFLAAMKTHKKTGHVYILLLVRAPTGVMKLRFLKCFEVKTIKWTYQVLPNKETRY